MKNNHLAGFFRFAESTHRNVFSRFLANEFLFVFIVFIWIETITSELLPQPLGAPAHNLQYNKTLSLLKQDLWQFVVIKEMYFQKAKQAY